MTALVRKIKTYLAVILFVLLAPFSFSFGSMVFPVKGLPGDSSCPDDWYSVVWSGRYSGSDRCKGTGGHPGMDIRVPSGTDAQSIGSGTVYKSYDSSSWGGLIVIKHSNISGTNGPIWSIYAHLKTRYVQQNDDIPYAGYSIGLSGGAPDDPNSGTSTGPHLHFQIDKGDTFTSPYWPSSSDTEVVDPHLSNNTYDPIAFIESHQSSNRAQVEAFVTRFYQQCLGRDPDAPGLAGWVDALLNGTLSGADVANGFIFSEEFLNRYTTNEDFVTILYRAFFDREPDSGGYTGWLNALYDGQTRAFVLDGFLNSVEFANLCAVYGIKPTSENTGDTGTWFQEGAVTVQTYYGSAVINKEERVTFIQNGNQVTGESTRTLTLNGCCGPIQATHDFTGTVNGNVITSTIVWRGQRTCSCQDDQGGHTILIGRPTGTTYPKTFVVSADGQTLTPANPTCWLFWHGECVLDTGSYWRID